MSNTSTFFTDDDTFLSTKNKSGASVSPHKQFSPLRETEPVSSENQNEHGSFAGNVTLPNIKIGTSTVNMDSNDISPYTPIKSLIESPFRMSNHSRKITASLGTPKYDPLAINADQLLKMKIRAHQENYHDKINSLRANSISNEINRDTYLHSAFKPRRTISSFSSSNEKNVGSSLSSKKEDTAEIHNAHSSINDMSNPYVVQALGRMVNKELELRKLLVATLSFLVYRLLRSIIRLFFYTSPWINNTTASLSKYLMSLTNQTNTPFLKSLLSALAQLVSFESFLAIGTYIEYILSLTLLSVITSSAYRLLKPQDKCLDLPLTKAQRKILGLGDDTSVSDEDDEDGDSDAVLKQILTSSPQRHEKPARVVVPDTNSMEDVMGSLNSLAIGNKFNSRSYTNKNDIGNLTWSAGASQKAPLSTSEANLENLRKRLSSRNNYTDCHVGKDILQPSGKYMYEVSNEIRKSKNNLY